MSQKDLAKRINCGVPLICKWEKGRLSPGIKNIVKIEEVLKTGILTKKFMEKVDK